MPISRREWFFGVMGSYQNLPELCFHPADALFSIGVSRSLSGLVGYWGLSFPITEL